MASTTGIEIGPDTCLLAGVRPARAGGAEVFAVHRISADDWPLHDDAKSDVLRAARRGKRLPVRASVVAWGLPDGAVDDEISRIALRPVEAAGFRITSILTPPQALARLAATRPRNSPSEATAWLALNTHGVAIAIVSGSELLFSRTFQWTYDPNLVSGKAQLLQRYTLIARVAPELRRGMDIVRQSHGLPVEAVVTCGDLPELRSLTMPLIEELDLEVETLDSMDGLHAAGKATLDRFGELAPALRLAVAAALAPVARSPRTSNLRAAMGIAAAVALIAALAWTTFSYWSVSPVRVARTTPSTQQAPAARPPAPSARSPLAAPPLSSKPSPAPVDEPRPLPTAGTREPKPPPVARRESKPAPLPATANAERKAPSVASVPAPPFFSRPEPALAPGPPLARNAPPPVEQSPAERRPPTVPSSTVTMSPEQHMARPDDARRNMSPSPATRAPDARQAPLKEPLPKVDSILIDQDRRLALIDGAIVGVGDTIGGRVVVQIDRDAIVLSEPSGRIVRVRLRAPGINH
jgi:hypothetical protein